MRLAYSVVALLATAAFSLSSPYHTIVDRNVFGLKEPAPPPVAQNQPPPRPAPKLTLTGIADFSSMKWAFITRTDPGRPPRNYTLTPGEREGGLQLLAINAQSATVTLRVDGLETVDLKLPADTNRVVKAVPPRPQVPRYRPLPIRR